MICQSKVGATGKNGALEKALAVLITCTRNKVRPKPLTEIADWLEIAVDALGSYSAVAERIGLSSKMLRQFSYVRRLEKRVQQLFERRKLDSVDAATHLAMLPPDDQEPVAEALVAGDIDTLDLRAVVELRRTRKVAEVSNLVRRVMDSKVKQQYVAEFVVRGSRNREQIMARFTSHIPSSEIIALEVEGVLGRLVLTHKGKQVLTKTAKALRTPLKYVIPKLLNN